MSTAAGRPLELTTGLWFDPAASSFKPGAAYHTASLNCPAAASTAAALGGHYHTRTQRRRALRNAHGGRLRQAMFMVDLQLRGLRGAVHELSSWHSASQDPWGQSLARTWTRSQLLLARPPGLFEPCQGAESAQWAGLLATTLPTLFDQSLSLPAVLPAAALQRSRSSQAVDNNKQGGVLGTGNLQTGCAGLCLSPTSVQRACPAAVVQVFQDSALPPAVRLPKAPTKARQRARLVRRRHRRLALLVKIIRRHAPDEQVQFPAPCSRLESGDPGVSPGGSAAGSASSSPFCPACKVTDNNIQGGVLGHGVLSDYGAETEMLFAAAFSQEAPRSSDVPAGGSAAGSASSSLFCPTCKVIDNNIQCGVLGHGVPWDYGTDPDMLFAAGFSREAPGFDRTMPVGLQSFYPETPDDWIRALGIVLTDITAASDLPRCSSQLPCSGSYQARASRSSQDTNDSLQVKAGDPQAGNSPQALLSTFTKAPDCPTGNFPAPTQKAVNTDGGLSDGVQLYRSSFDFLPRTLMGPRLVTWLFTSSRPAAKGNALIPGGSWADGSSPFSLQVGRTGTKTMQKGKARQLLRLTHSVQGVYRCIATRLEDEGGLFRWDPVGICQPGFNSVSAIMWTEPSSGFSAIGRKLHVYCDAIRHVVLYRPIPIVRDDPAFVVSATTAVFRAEAVLWRHLSGWKRAHGDELQPQYEALHSVICQLYGYEPYPGFKFY